jgi:hypothetical protein
VPSFVLVAGKSFQKNHYAEDGWKFRELPLNLEKLIWHPLSGARDGTKLLKAGIKENSFAREGYCLK